MISHTSPWTANKAYANFKRDILWDEIRWMEMADRLYDEYETCQNGAINDMSCCIYYWKYENWKN